MTSSSHAVAFAIVAGLLCGPQAGAQQAVLEEIIVRGELRETSLDSTPSSVSVLALEAIDAASVNHLEEVLGRLPNVNFASGASRARFVQIRGVGERGQFAEPLNPSVGLLIDGVDMSGIGTAATLFDVQQVEVFRGPQGTLYGANALAGLINVRTRAATDQFTARVAADGGNYGARGLGLAVSGPLSNNLTARVAARSYRDDGFIRNDFLNRDDTTKRDENTWRGKLRWQPAEDAELTLTIGSIDVDNGYDNFSLDNTRVTLSDAPGQDEQDTRYASAAWAAPIAAGKRIAATLGHADSEIDYGYDEDWTFDGFHPFGYSSTDRYQRDRKTTTADVRILSDVDGRVEWVAGLFGLAQEVNLTRTYTFLPAPFSSAFDIERAALYGEASTTFGDGWRIRAGLRVERHTADYTDSEGVAFSPEDDLIGGRLVLEKALASGGLAYASATRGYKAGGFNTDGSLDTDLREFEPETLWNLEAGIKQAFWGDRLALRGALFYMLRDDVQISTSVVRVRPDGSSEFIDFVGNGAEGTNLGAELEVDLAITDRLSANLNVGLLDTEFRDYTNGAGEDLSDREQAHAPRYQLRASVDYAVETGWFARAALEARDEFFFSDTHNVRSEAYALLNAAAGFRADRWSVTVWGRNLADEDYAVRGFFFGNDPRDNYTPRGFTQLGEPRRYGVSVTFEWE